MAEFDWFQRQDSSESSDAQQPDDALDWAKQAYARLKAQQEAEKSAAAAPSAEPAQEPAAAPDPCLLYTSPSPRDKRQSRMPSSA